MLFHHVSSKAGWLSLASIILSMLFGFHLPAHAAVGRMPGAFAVSATGSATYNIPIWAPPGPHGLQPKLSLTYDSRQGSGSVGVGWALTGLSSISRCNATYAQDTSPAPITLTYGDVFCMDGLRLRLTSGTYGMPGSTYQTEVADFRNVTAYGSAGNGPQYFIVKDRNGVSYQYGNGGGSQILASNAATALAWFLNKITDPAGNTMAISYTAATGTAVPSTISWTPSAYGSSSYNYTMVFGYGTNVAQSSTYAYVAGTPVVDTDLLSSITINYLGSTVKKYLLSYQQSPTTQREELIQIQECADAGATNCLAPTTITYQNGAAGVSATSSSVGMGSGANWYLANYDFNGDGYHDLVYQLSSGEWYVAFGSASGYGAAVDTGVNTPGYIAGRGYLLVGDLLGTGQAGLLANNGGTWWYYRWNGSAFSGTSTGVPYDTAATSFALADTNGDGLPDLVSLELNPGGAAEAAVYTRLNSSSGGTLSFGAPTAAYTNTDSEFPLTSGSLDSIDMQRAGPVSYFDFDGDGRQDLILHLTYRDSADRINIHSGYQLLGNGSTFTAVSFGTDGSTPYFVNWNNDACTDYITGSMLVISACNGNAGASVNLGYKPLAVMDWDGDGRTDLVYASGGYLYVQLSTGQGLSTPIATSIPWNSAATYIGYDVNGDALDDLTAWTGNAFSYNLHNSGGQPPDLLSKITDGYGNSASPTYVPLTQTVGSTYFEWNDAQYPYQNYNGPLYLVNAVTYSDPSSTNGGSYAVNHYYDGAWTNLQGRGFSGLGSHQTYDSRNGVWETVGYERAFPLTGMLVSQSQTLNNSPAQAIFNLSRSNAAQILDGTSGSQRYFPYIANETLKNYEVGGRKNTQLIKTTSTNYSYDNYGNATTIATTVTDNDSGSPYFNQSWATTTTNTPEVDAGNWCLPLFTQTQTVYTASGGGAAVTRTKQFTPDTSYCRYSQIVTEPTSPSYKVTESFGFDSFGNVNSDTVAGIGMASRQTSTNWGTTGQFPMSVTDPTAATVSYNYNFSYGLRSSFTDPNGLTTSWQYGDGFGRRTQETRPDGTYTTWTYNDCVNWGGCLIGSHTLALAHYVYVTNGSLETSGTDYFDPLGRPLLSNNMMLAGGWDRNEVRYDSLGRTVQRASPCTWSGVTATCPYWSTTNYDTLSRPKQIQRPINASNSTLETTTYDYEGRTTIVTDGNSHARTLITDVNGWLRQTQDASGYTVTLGYDAAGSKTSVTDSLGDTLLSASYQYGLAPYATAVTDADLGSWNYTYDALGEQTGWTDAKGQQFTANYDALGRPTDRYEPDLYTHWTWGTSAAAREIGQLHSVCTGTGAAPSSCTAAGYAESEAYDNLGRLWQRSIQIPSDATYTYTWAYSATTGLLDTLTYPASTSGYQFQVKYGYANGLLQSVTDVSDSPNVALWTANSVDAGGRFTQETLGNGEMVDHSFDAVTGLPNSITAGPSTAPTSLQNNSYLFDNVGNLIQRQDNVANTTENVYMDSLDRLDHTVGDSKTTLTYDNMGRLATWSVYSGTTNVNDYTTQQPGCSYYANAQPHALRQYTQGTGVGSSCYDKNGNLVSQTWRGAPTSTLTWTSYNQPNLITSGWPNINTATSSSQFFYDQNHQRWKQIASYSGTPETTIYIGGLLEKMTNSGGTYYRHYVPAGNNFVVYTDSPALAKPAIYYVTEDHLGSTAVITDQTGALVADEKFSAGGINETSAQQATSAATVTRHAYTGQESLDNVFLVNMNGRLYAPSPMYFLSPDPHIPDPTDTRSYNRYAYVKYNPLTYIDPTGFTDTTPQSQREQGEIDFSDFSGDSSGSDSSGPTRPIPEVVVSADRNPSGFVGNTAGSAPTGLPNRTGGNLEQVVVQGTRSPKSGPPSGSSPNGGKNDSSGLDEVVVRGGRTAPQGNQQPTSEVVITAQRPHPYNPFLCAKAGVGCDPSIQPPSICFGSFAFAGRETEFLGANIFAGQLVESTVPGLDVGPLYEGAVGPQGAAVGGAITQSILTGKTSGFLFGGGKLSLGPLGGIQVGSILGPNELGAYFEGHRGLNAGGFGFAFSSCQ